MFKTSDSYIVLLVMGILFIVNFFLIRSYVLWLIDGGIAEPLLPYLPKRHKQQNIKLSGSKIKCNKKTGKCYTEDNYPNNVANNEREDDKDDGVMNDQNELQAPILENQYPYHKGQEDSVYDPLERKM